MRTFLGIVVVLDLYVIIYYRLLVRHYYQKAHGVRETAFGTVFSLPPYASLPERGRVYARRYWITVTVLVACVLALAVVTDFPAWKIMSGSAIY